MARQGLRTAVPFLASPELFLAPSAHLPHVLEVVRLGQVVAKLEMSRSRDVPQAGRSIRPLTAREAQGRLLPSGFPCRDPPLPDALPPPACAVPWQALGKLPVRLRRAAPQVPIERTARRRIAFSPSS